MPLFSFGSRRHPGRISQLPLLGIVDNFLPQCTVRSGNIPLIRLYAWALALSCPVLCCGYPNPSPARFQNTTKRSFSFVGLSLGTCGQDPCQIIPSICSPDPCMYSLIAIHPAQVDTQVRSAQACKMGGGLTVSGISCNSFSMTACSGPHEPRLRTIVEQSAFEFCKGARQ